MDDNGPRRRRWFELVVTGRRRGAVVRTATAIAAVMIVAGLLAPAGRAAPAPSTAYPGGTWEPPDPRFAVAAERNVPVTMSDGVTLVADVYRPLDPASGSVADGPFPVLLAQTPYSGSLGLTGATDQEGPGAYFVRRGYVYVSADVRGTGRSLGRGEFMGPREAQDGAELVEWAAQLDGTNGIVGLHGCSYLGHTQVYTAGVLGPDSPVKAMIPMCTSSDPYRETYMENGVPAPAWEGAGLAAGTLLGPTIEAYLVPKYLESQAGGDTAYYRSFWQDRDHTLDARAIARAGIPALLWNGWDDSGQGGLDLFTALQHASFGRPTHQPLRPNQPVTGRYQLIVGDWAHGGGLDEGIQLQWYETWLKGARTGLPTRTRTPIHVQDRTTGAWANVDRHPIATSYTPMHLATGGRLTHAVPAPGADAIEFGPPELPGTTLTYTSEPLPDGATLGGPVGIRLVARSSTADLRLRADLLDVAPDGTASLITTSGVLGSLRALDPDRTWRDDRGDPVRPYLALQAEAPVVPGARVLYEFALQHTLWTLAPGHRLRLEVATHAGTERCIEKMAAITTSPVGCRPRVPVLARLLGGSYRIELGPGGSLVNLPLLPAGSLAPVRSGTTPTGATPLPLDW